MLPDLRHSTPQTQAVFQQIVLGGRKAVGMPDFTGRLSEEDVEAIKAYVQSLAAAEHMSAH